jgi:quercetin dioxygenase-like cupin family protein
MKLFAVAALSAAALAAQPAQAQSIEISPNGSRAAVKGVAQTFTGSVTVDPLFATNQHRPFSSGHVTFEPGARSAWHTHPAGQILIVTAGAGWVQQWDGERREIKPGDVVWIPPGVKHWHGATATTSISHIALQQAVNGTVVDWLEQVGDSQYGR